MNGFTGYGNNNLGFIQQSASKGKQWRRSGNTSTINNGPQIGYQAPQTNQASTRRVDPMVNISSQLSQGRAPNSINFVDQSGPIQLPRITSQTVVGAPTSLTNLAHLSGITVLPVNSLQHCPTVGHSQGIDFGSSASTQPQLIRQGNMPTNSVVIGGSTVNNYNPTNVSSIQLLNQHEPMASGPGLWTPKNLKLQNPRKPSSKSKVDRQAASNRVTMNASHPTAPTSRASNQQMVQQPDIHSVNSINDLNNLIQQTRDSVAAQASQPDNDMTLIKLMAILNNPALTITPVDLPNPSVSSEPESGWTDNLFPMNPSNHEVAMLESSDQIRSIPDATTLPIIDSMQSSDQMSKVKTNTKSKTKARIPKSAANIQLLADGGLVGQNDQLRDESVGRVPVEGTNLVPTVDNQVALDWLSSLAVSRMDDDDDSTVTLSWLPNRESTGVDNASTQELDREISDFGFGPQRSSQNMSVQLLHEFAGQAELSEVGEPLPEFKPAGPIDSEPVCLVRTPRLNVENLVKRAKGREIVYSVSSEINKNRNVKRKIPMRTSERRLWLPQKEATNKPTTSPSRELAPIEVKAIEEREVSVSEQHLMLEKMVEIAESGQRKKAHIEPDDIFVNRSKRIMSKIDTVLERKKRKRFERICDRSSDQDVASQEHSEDSDDESIIDETSNLFRFTVVPVQLPLDEALTSRKRDHLSAVGLVSRDDKNKLSIQQYENRLSAISALALEEVSEEMDEIQQFVDMIRHTDGTDIQLRTETNIKRNDLPFIEGLNRNTSRIKMSYMSALGLDKRSKRTTLYKVTKSSDTNNIQGSKQQQSQMQPLQKAQHPQPQQQIHNDLINKQNANGPLVGQVRALVKSKKVESTIQNGNSQLNLGASHIIAKAVRLAQASCRGAIPAPNKDEYMKSLGLTAS